MLTLDKGNPPALVLGADVNGLGIIRALGKAGVYVYGGYQNAGEIGRWSRYCEAVRVPPASHPQELEEWLTEFGTRVGTTVLFLTSDQMVAFVVERWDALKRYFRCPIPEPALARRLLTKVGQHTVATQHGLETPNTYAPSDLAGVDAIADLIKYPCIIKPNIGFENPLPARAKNLRFRNKEELQAFFNFCPGAIGHVVLQEIIPGGDDSVVYSTLYLDETYKPRARFSAQKIRQYPPNFGITSYAVSGQCETMQSIAEDFLFKIGYSGLVDIEFKKDFRDGSYKFIELNMRSHWANSHSTRCGVNLFLIAYLSQIGQLAKNSRPPDYMSGIRWVDCRGDAGAFWRGWRENKISALSWFIDITKARSFAVFDLRDPLPFFISSWEFLKGVTR